MQHLTPVGLTQDGKSLVLVSDAGEEYVVTVDLKFRTALRGDNARLGQLEMKMESALRPRDIQARIRAGESAEDVAAAAQTTVEAIMPYAGPVLAERAHVAQTALKASIRRRTNETTPGARTLDEASRQHLTSVGVRADDVLWDAWRRDDGRWSLVGTYVVRGTEFRAVFTYDQPGRYVVAEDEVARVLTGEASPAPEGTASPERRLTSVPGTDDELPLGDDAIELVRGPQPVEEPETAEEMPSFEDVTADHADADWIAELPVDELPIDEAPVDEAPATPPSDEDVTEPEPVAAADPEPEPSAADEPKSRKKGRSSVPSWDEIMFGGGGTRE